MRYERILTVFMIALLFLNGLSVIAYSADGKEMELDQAGEGEGKKGENIEEHEKSEKPETKNPERKGDSFLNQSYENHLKSVKNKRLHRHLNRFRSKFEDHFQNEKGKNVGDDERNSEADASETKKSRSKSVDQSSSSETPDQQNIKMLSDEDIKASSDELIINSYQILFQENMTSLHVDANFSIYKVEYNGTIYTAQEIRDAPNTESIVENISDRMNKLFQNTTSSMFPDAEKKYYEMNNETGTSGPINFSTSADIYLKKSSFGFDQNNDELDVSDVILGVMKMGGSVQKGVTLEVKSGHNSTYKFQVPSNLTMQANDTWGVSGGTNHTFDDGNDRVSTWIFNNSGGSSEVTLNRTLNMTHQDPVDVNREIMNGTGLIDMTSFETVDIKDTISVFSINISGYNKPGTDEPLLPKNISDLNIVTADGLRLFVDNNLTTLQQIKARSVDPSINKIENSIENIFGEKPEMKFEWAPSTVSGYDVTTMGTDPAFRSYINSTEPVGFTEQKLDMPAEADLDELITETLKLDAVISSGFDFVVEDGMYFTLKIMTPENVKFRGSDPIENDRYLYQRTIDNREGNNLSTWVYLEIFWAGEVRRYYEENIETGVSIDMKSFDEIPIDITVRTYSADLDRYGDQFDIPTTVTNLNYVDANFIRVAVRNGLVELSTLRQETIEPARDYIKAGLNDLLGESVEMNFTWESLDWKTWSHSEWEDKSSSLGPFTGELSSVEPATFEPSGLDLPEEADVGEVIRSILRLNATIEKDISLNSPSYADIYVNVIAPEDILIENGERDGKRWSRTYPLEGDENTATMVWRYDGEVKEIEGEEVSLRGTFDMQNMESIDITLNTTISAVDLQNYDAVSVPGPVENLRYIDSSFIRTAVDNGLIEWGNITDEMNSTVKEIENKVPNFLGDLDFSYSDPGRDSGPITRHYKIRDFQPNMTVSTQDENLQIDQQFIESMMESGAVVDFELPSISERFENYSILLKFKVPEFMDLYDSQGKMLRYEGYYEIESTEGFDGELRSDGEVPDAQSIELDMDIDLEKVSLSVNPLGMDYKADAGAKVDAQVKAGVIEVPENMKDSLPDEVTLRYATADLIRQAERSGIFDRQEIIDMVREGKDIQDFEGLNSTLSNALGSEDIGVTTRYREGTWTTEDGEDSQPIVIEIDSDFTVPLKQAAGQNAFEIYRIDMGELEIPSSAGIDTNFRIVFPSGIKPDVQETENVKLGKDENSRNYIEVQRSEDSEQSLTINPDIVVTEGILLSGDIYLHGIPLWILTIALISLVILGVGIKVAPYKNMKKKKLIRQGMDDALEEESDPDRWLAYIPQGQIDKYGITRDSLFELGLEEELQEKRREAGGKQEKPPEMQKSEKQEVDRTETSPEESTDESFKEKRSKDESGEVEEETALEEAEEDAEGKENSEEEGDSEEQVEESEEESEESEEGMPQFAF